MTKKATYDILFIPIVAAICHILFSKYGFNPTDEGFVLSASNRILHGQIPHVDFSSVRPLGYAYLHIPELLISKTHFFLVSRFVFWLEQVLIAFLWIRFLINYSKQEISTFNKYSLVIICFVFNVHYFPASVLHTIDGLLMCMIGLNIISSEKKWSFIGFIFIGFAALCKQNYLVMLPIILFLFGRKNVLLYSVAGLLPIIIYVVLISFYGGWNDLITQLSGHNELIKVGMLSYTKSRLFFAGIITSFFVLKSRYTIIKHLLFCTLLLVCFYAMCTYRYHERYSFLILGSSIGALMVTIIKSEFKFCVVFTIGITLGWCVSISVGYNSPALFLGASLTSFYFYLNNSSTAKPSLKVSYILFILTPSLVLFCYIRYHLIYRETPKSTLTYSLNNIVEGASGIYTNKNTFLVLQELDSLKKTIPGIIVIPDFTSCNILHSHASKILTEWPNKTEIPNQKILDFIIRPFVNDTSSLILIPKYNTSVLCIKFEKTSPEKVSDFLLLSYIFNHYKKSQEFSYFELYRKQK